MPPPKNPSDLTPPTMRQSNNSFKCFARQLALASPPSNSHSAPRMDADVASNTVAITAAATVAATAAVAATTIVAAVAATVAVAAVATRMAVVVAMVATMAAVMAVAIEEIRPQAAYPPCQLSGTRSGTTASPMAAMLTTTTPVQHVLAQVRTTNVQ
jgi:hypothetical protein